MPNAQLFNIQNLMTRKIILTMTNRQSAFGRKVDILDEVD